MNKQYRIARTYHNFSNQIQHLIDALSIGNTGMKVNGSAGLRCMLYPADIDLFQSVNMSYDTVQEACKHVEKELQKVITTLMSMSDVYIGDIKCGCVKSEPIRWKPKDILKGSVHNINLVDCIPEPAMTKIDVIAYIDSVYTDVSVIYEFKNKGKVLNNYNSVPQLQALKDDINKLYKEKNYFKCAKRIFSVAMLQYHLNDVSVLVSFFNSNLGLLYQITQNIQCLLYMFDNLYSLPFKKVDTELDTMINRLSKIYDLSDYMEIDNSVVFKLRALEKVTREHSSVMVKGLTSILDKLNKVLQKDSYEFLEKHHFFPLQ